MRPVTVSRPRLYAQTALIQNLGHINIFVNAFEVDPELFMKEGTRPVAVRGIPELLMPLKLIDTTSCKENIPQKM